jgi:predicted RNA binding protein YcfA (HicA-like mRNA interferase family)
VKRSISGRICIGILKKKFGFQVIRQKGSHVVLRRDDKGTVVPLHKELKIGTFKKVLKLAGISEKDFWKKK